LNADFDRFGYQVSLFEISRFGETQRPAIAALCEFSVWTGIHQTDATFSVKNTRMAFDYTYFKYANLDKKAPVKILGRWTSFCFALDFEADSVAWYVDGRPFLGPEGHPNPLSALLSNNTELPMVVRIGHYYFDNKPLIGRLIDINMWSR
jgi:hypothetical protein